jgi:hypothetical protein
MRSLAWNKVREQQASNSPGKSIKRLTTKTFLLAAGLLLSSSLNAQIYTPPRTPAGDPDLQGIWQVRNTANWDVAMHPPSRTWLQYFRPEPHREKFNLKFTSM